MTAERIWQLKLSGSPAIRQEGGTWTALGRKSAALLAYLALQGPTSRVRLAQLLWPDLAEGAARAYLRHLIHELQRYKGLLLATDPLQLAPLVKVEATGTGQLLEGWAFDGCPEFGEWLDYQRLQLHAHETEALDAAIKRLESQGEFAAALPLARQRVVLEPLSEEACRQLMRLLYLSGDRAAALAAYQRCQHALRLELGIEPLPETTALAWEIEQGTGLPQTIRTVRHELPLAVMRPPLLAGRARAWALMEEAWSRAQMILLSGPAGIGKTRLMRDFAGSKGSFFYFEARESSLPYGAAEHFIRKLLKAYPRLKLASWVKRELSRLVSELAEDEPPPIEDARHLLDATLELVTRLRPWLQIYLTDNLHLFDRSSFEAGAHAILRAETEGVRVLAAVRLDELDPWCRAALGRMVDAEIAALIELEPLDAAGVGEMLGEMALTEHEALVAPLHQLTGGNPLFIVETLKSLIAAGKVEAGELKNAFPAKVDAIFKARFSRLSTTAFRLLQMIAVAQEDFSADLAAHALGVPALEVAEGLAELETAQLLRGSDFCYDLVREAARRATPAAVASFFHRDCTEYLEGRGLAR